MTTNPAVWYLMRSTGVVALLLLTLSFSLGIARRTAGIRGTRGST